MASALFQRKPLHLLQGDAAHESGLKRVLGPLELTMLGIGAIIGTGIFVLTGTAAAGGADHAGAGPAIVYSFIIVGFACALAALCYAEFASHDSDRRARPTPTPTPRLANSPPGSSAGT